MRERLWDAYSTQAAAAAQAKAPVASKRRGQIYLILNVGGQPSSTRELQSVLATRSNISYVSAAADQ